MPAPQGAGLMARIDSAQIREEQVQRNRRRFGQDDYPGGIPGEWRDDERLLEADHARSPER